jgi:hypothetical protein
VRQFPVSEGRRLTRAEDEEEQWVTVVNEGLRRIIFPEGATVGAVDGMAWQRMSVVGVVRDEALSPTSSSSSSPIEPSASSPTRATSPA